MFVTKPAKKFKNWQTLQFYTVVKVDIQTLAKIDLFLRLQTSRTRLEIRKANGSHKTYGYNFLFSTYYWFASQIQSCYIKNWLNLPGNKFWSLTDYKIQMSPVKLDYYLNLSIATFTNRNSKSQPSPTQKINTNSDVFIRLFKMRTWQNFSFNSSKKLFYFKKSVEAWCSFFIYLHSDAYSHSYGVVEHSACFK